MLTRGMQPMCPRCGGETKVIETGWSVRFQAYARRRQCDDCHGQFYTSEAYIPDTFFKPKKETKVIRIPR